MFTVQWSLFADREHLNWFNWEFINTAKCDTSQSKCIFKNKYYDITVEDRTAYTLHKKAFKSKSIKVNAYSHRTKRAPIGCTFGWCGKCIEPSYWKWKIHEKNAIKTSIFILIIEFYEFEKLTNDVICRRRKNHDEWT